jgi:hypothetical protein
VRWDGRWVLNFAAINCELPILAFRSRWVHLPLSWHMLQVRCILIPFIFNIIVLTRARCSSLVFILFFFEPLLFRSERTCRFDDRNAILLNTISLNLLGIVHRLLNCPKANVIGAIGSWAWIEFR